MATLEPQETLQYRIFREHYDRLVHSIQDPLPLAVRLFSKGVIKSAVKDHVSVLGLSTLEKNNALLSAVEKHIQLDPQKLNVFLSALNEDPSLQSLVESMQKELLNPTLCAQTISSSLPSQGFSQPSGMLQPSGYQIPPPQHMHSGVGGHHSTFIPSQHLQQGVAPPNLQYPPFQHLYSGIGGHLPPFTPFQLPQQGFATPNMYLPQKSGVGGYKPLYPQHKLQEKLLKTLRKSIKENNVDSFHCHLEELERLLQNSERMKGLLEDAGVLCYGAFIGSNPMVETLIQKGVDINAKSGVPGILIKWSPLHWAAREGHVNTVKCLVENGAEVNSEDYNGMTPLHCAALKGQFGTLRYLVGAGANINIKERNGWTPLYCAALEGHVDTVQVLVEKGADINVKNNDGETPLNVAVKLRCEAVEAYLNRAADPNILGEGESTGRPQGQKQSLKETDNSPGEEPPATLEKEEETEECDHEEIDLQLENLLQKYRHQPTIKHKSLKCLFTGPPRVGKTTLKKRLLKLIKNLISSGVVSPSGGLEKPISVIIGETRECVTVVMESDIDWKPQHDLLDEAQIVLEFIDKTHHQTPQTPGPKSPPKQVLQTPVATIAVPFTSGPDPPTPREAEADTLDEAKQLMQEVLASRKLHTIKDIEKTTTLYFMDTGGQPEFHEIMPIILNGPALHLIFFNLAFDLNEPIPIEFFHQDGTDSITYVSSYTGKQMIFQLLSSLYYFTKSLSPDSEPAAVLIGTHLDQLKGDDEMKVNGFLNQLFTNTEFHNQGFLTYPTRDKSTIFTPVNNYSGDEEEIHRLQAFLKRVIHDRFSPVELPSSWLFFHLLLRHRYENSPGVCKLTECRALAKGCGLDEDDVPQVLRYIHQHLGTILFYEDVPGLNELVICDPNVLFKGIYQLVAVSFGGDKGYHTITAEIRKTGEIHAKVLKRISTQSSSSLLKNEHIIELLMHFKILTKLPSDDGVIYFMPCLLRLNNSLELSCKALQTLYPPPLLVRFKGNYIPMGVFSALVVKLLESSWELDQDKCYRNHIVFNMDDDFSVELIVHPAYLEFRIRISNPTEEDAEEIHQFCMMVCKTVVDTLISVLDLHAHTKKAKFQLGFYCSGSLQADGQPHFCRLSNQSKINPKTFASSDSPHCQDQCCLPPQSTIWLEQWKNKRDTRDQGHACVESVDDITVLDEDDLHDVISAVTDLAGRWQHLGIALRLRSGDLESILSASAHSPSDCLRKLLTLWLKQNYNVKKLGNPTWRRLVEAVEDPVGGNDHALAQKIAAKHPAVKSGN